MKVIFFKKPKTKGFKYIPRYYNEQKEKLESRIEKIKTELDNNNGLENRLKKEWNISRNKVLLNKKSNLVIFIISLILLAMYYIYLKQFKI